MARYTHLVLAFLVCGYYHFLMDVAQGMDVRRSGTVRFYFLQAVTIAIEDLVQWLWRSRRSVRWMSEGGRPALWARTVGYAWTILWLSWSAPARFYPVLETQETGMSRKILSFVIATPVVERIWS